jgi:non-heme chloroperoxidase
MGAHVLARDTPKALGTAPGDWAEGDTAELKLMINGVTYDRREFTTELSKWMVKRELKPAELEWIVGLSLHTPTSVAVLLLTDMMLADYIPEAKALDGKIPVLNVVREEWAPAALAWIKANVPRSETFVFKGHMHFWSEPRVFNRAVDAFLTKVK